MALVNPAEDPADRVPIGGGASATPQAESVAHRDPFGRGISIGGAASELDWGKIKAESRRILWRSRDAGSR